MVLKSAFEGRRALSSIRRAHATDIQKILQEMTGRGMVDSTVTSSRVAQAVRETYQARADAIWQAILREFEIHRDAQTDADDLRRLFAALFDAEYSDALEQSRSRLALFDGQHISDVMKEADRLRRHYSDEADYLFLEKQREPAGRSAWEVAKTAEEYVAQSRIQELAACPKRDWDLRRLIRLCEELNVNYANGCFMSCAMLVRAIADHVPPIFGCGSFSEVANNSSGGRSFRKSMQNLHQSMRNIADAHLHVQIRRSESLPMQPQIDFRSDLDVLLGEIARISK
jgi:hypothetical protein